MFRKSDQFLYGVRGPWPQPAPRLPNGMPPAVLHIPFKEQLDLSVFVISRYRATLLAFRPIARLFAKTHKGLDKVTDAEFSHIFSKTVFSKFINSTLDPIDKKNFKKLLGKGNYCKADFSAMSLLESFPGIFISPTVTIFKKYSNHELSPVGIFLNGRVFTPDQKNAWELAKYFSLQGAVQHLVTGFHGRLHFPMDCINAVTKSVLPKDHLIFKLFYPHTRFSLALNDRVLEHPRSVLSNSQEEIYTPIGATMESIRLLVSATYSGIPGNSSYQPYEFPLRPPKIDSIFGDTIDAYYEAILKFTKKVTQKISKEDAFIKEWAEHLSQMLPGFPDGNKIFEKNILAQVCASYICDVSVMHAADHYSYSRQSINKLPFRLRTPPPDSDEIPPIDRKTLVSEDDVFRYKMAHEMFFKPTNITLLCTTRYELEDSELEKAEKEFLKDLEKVDRSKPDPDFIPLSEISRSIQY